MCFSYKKGLLMFFLIWISLSKLADIGVIKKNAKGTLINSKYKNRVRTVDK